MTRTSGQSLPNSESRRAPLKPVRPAPPFVHGWVLLPVCLVTLFAGSTRGDDLQLGGLRLYNQGHDLRLLVLQPETNTVYELQSTSTLEPGTTWTRAQLGHAGQTNFIVLLPSNAPAFFRLRIPPLTAPAQLTLAEDTALSLAKVRVHLPESVQAVLSLETVTGMLWGPQSTSLGTLGAGTGAGSLLWSGSAASLQRALEQTRYVPPTNFFGQDRIRLELTFTNQASRERVDLELVITPVDDRPVGVSEAYACAENSTLFIPGPGVLANDTDVEGTALSARLHLGPGHGTLALEPDGGFVYLPDPDFTGTDRFAYFASDGANESDPVSVEITVAPVSEAASVRLTAPPAGARFTEGATIALELQTPPEPALQRVDYYRGSNLIASASTPPFSSAWLNALSGTHTLRAQAWEMVGRSLWTADVTVQVEPDCDRDGVSDADEIAQGTDPCDGLNQQAPRLTVVGGDVQTAPPGTLLPEPLRVRLVTRTGAVLTNRLVRFTAEEGDARIALTAAGPWETRVDSPTDGAGLASVWAMLPPVHGVSLIRAAATQAGEETRAGFIVTAVQLPPAWSFENVPIAVAAGAEHTLALRADGTVLRWGRNQEGQLGVDPDRLALQPNPEAWPGLSNVIAIAAGGQHSLILTADGAVTDAGEYFEHERAFVPPGLAHAVSIAAGQDHSLALLANGTVRAWGDSFSNHEPPPGLSGVVAITAGSGFSVALRDSGTVIAWGFSLYLPNFGQTNVPPGLRNVRAISAGGYHTLALRDDGTVVAWGNNGQGQSSVPPDLNHVVAIAAGFAHSLALRSDGTIAAWGDNRSGELGELAGLTEVVALGAGGGTGLSHSLALRANGSLWAWGDNTSGQLGLGDLSSSPVPRLVSLPPGGFVTDETPFELHTPLQ